MYACKIQNWKFGSVLTTAYPADSRKAYCKVYNNAIIGIFFAFNCCKKDQNSTENLSEWTPFGAVKTSAPRKYDTVQNGPCSFRQSSSIRNVFHFSSRQKCNAKLFSQRSSALLFLRIWYHTRTTFFASLFSLEVKLLWRNAFARGQGLGR